MSPRAASVSTRRRTYTPAPTGDDGTADTSSATLTSGPPSVCAVVPVVGAARTTARTGRRRASSRRGRPVGGGVGLGAGRPGEMGGSLASGRSEGGPAGLVVQQVVDSLAEGGDVADRHENRGAAGDLRQAGGVGAHDRAAPGHG